MSTISFNALHTKRRCSLSLSVLSVIISQCIAANCYKVGQSIFKTIKPIARTKQWAISETFVRIYLIIVVLNLCVFNVEERY